MRRFADYFRISSGGAAMTRGKSVLPPPPPPPPPHTHFFTSPCESMKWEGYRKSVLSPVKIRRQVRLVYTKLIYDVFSLLS